MMSFDWTIHFGDVLVGVIGLVLIPVTKLLVSTLWSLRDAVQELHLVVQGPAHADHGGLVGDVASLKRETLRHRDWLIRLSTEQGSKIEDRT